MQSTPNFSSAIPNSFKWKYFPVLPLADPPIEPDVIINIEIRNDFTLVYCDKIHTYGGLPLGTSNKTLSLISGGIDSPVSSFLAMKRGMKVEYIHFATPPHTSLESIEKVKDILKVLKKYDSNRKQVLHVVNFTILQNELMHITNESYRITLMRRMFIRIANIVANQISAKALTTGEALGQVASQTIESIAVINSVSDVPILRPLITYDKEEIIIIAKKIDTYNLSILPITDCCSLFVPKKPTTKPKLFVAKIQESQILFEEIIQEIIKNNIEKYNV